MDKLVIASNNAHKILEIKSILSGLFPCILSMREAGLDVDIPETGITFQENALIKARYVMQATGLPALADDSGLEVDALDGAPGVYSARYAGDHGDDGANNEKLRRSLEGVSNRKAHYACCIALYRPEQAPVTAMGYCHGEILQEYRGCGGFGYDPLFYMPQLGKTMAELTSDEKNAISHRAEALLGLRRLLEQEGRCVSAW